MTRSPQLSWDAYIDLVEAELVRQRPAVIADIAFDYVHADTLSLDLMRQMSTDTLRDTPNVKVADTVRRMVTALLKDVPDEAVLAPGVQTDGFRSWSASYQLPAGHPHLDVIADRKASKRPGEQIVRHMEGDYRPEPAWTNYCGFVLNEPVSA